MDNLKMFLRDHENSIVIISSMFFMTILGGILLTATGKAIEIIDNEIVETNVDPEGNEVTQRNNDRKVRFYSE